MANSYQLRDSHKSRVYDAEQKAFDQYYFGRVPERFATHAEMAQWVKRLTTSDWFKRHYPHVRKIDVFKNRAQHGACGNFNPLWGEGFIKIPDSPWGLKKWLVCHELGHAVNPLHKGVGYTRKAIASGHGREWRVNYIKLVQHVLGEDAARQLRDAFKAAKLKTTLKREITPEQKAALVARLKTAREARLARAPVPPAPPQPMVRVISGDRVYLSPVALADAQSAQRAADQQAMYADIDRKAQERAKRRRGEGNGRN